MGECNHRSSGKRAGQFLYKEGKPVQIPFYFVHNDYTKVSAANPLKAAYNTPNVRAFLQLNDDEISIVKDALTGKRRYAIVNVWRPWSVVESVPLACLDASTIELEELVVFKGVADSDYTGGAYYAKYRERHR